MATGTASAPSWLFSFVDLAFLLIIAMTQIADPNAPELGEMPLPRIEKDATGGLPTAAGDAWQLRVHPPSRDGASPFELIRGPIGPRVERLDEATLRERLHELNGSGMAKPLLAPHEDSRSQDLLDAVSLVEERWPSRRRTLVARLSEP